MGFILNLQTIHLTILSHPPVRGHGQPYFDWRIFEIKWNRYLWSLANSCLSKPLSDYDTRSLEPWQIEILGNVYEHPHLLTPSTNE